jgi:hypothetical protein
VGVLVGGFGAEGSEQANSIAQIKSERKDAEDGKINMT